MALKVVKKGWGFWAACHAASSFGLVQNQCRISDDCDSAHKGIRRTVLQSSL